jgi:hypothetical protein
MNKWQTIEYIWLNQKDISDNDLWMLVDSLNEQQVISILEFWLYKSLVPGDVFDQAQGILEFYCKNKTISLKQKRWLVLAISCYWGELSARARCQLQPMLN